MTIVQTLKALGPIDARSIGRDSLLRWMMIYPIVLALIVRWGLPFASARLMTRFGFDLVPYYTLLMSTVLLIAAMLSGIVIGFLLLDQRDDQTLTALQVTPLGLKCYLIYRVTLPMALSVVVSLAVLPLTGLLNLRPGFLVLAAVCAAPLAPFYALSLAALASNKVQGFAITKGMGVLLMLPILAYFVPPPAQWAFGVIPVYWPAKVFWLLDKGEAYAAPFIAGMAYQFLVVWLLLRRIVERRRPV
jgi:fluoroquinolone transport system permease protein